MAPRAPSRPATRVLVASTDAQEEQSHKTQLLWRQGQDARKISPSSHRLARARKLQVLQRRQRSVPTEDVSQWARVSVPREQPLSQREPTALSCEVPEDREPS